MENNTMRFSVEDIQDVTNPSHIDISQFSLLRVACFSTGVSAHDTIVDEETLRRTASSILQKPFVFEYDIVFDDLGTHSDREIAAGFVPHNADIDFSYMADGSLMLYCDVLIWKRYSQDLVKFFQRDNNRKSVSVEIEIFDSEYDEETGITKIKDFVYTCITGLGDMVTGAIDGAEAIMVFSKEYEEAKSDYEKSFSSKYADIDFTIPKSIKNVCQDALGMESSTSTSKAMAKYLIRNEKISPEKAKSLYNQFKQENLNATAKMLGSKGKKWISSLYESIKQVDDSERNFFADDTNDKEENVAKTKILENAKPDEEKDEDVMMAQEEEPKAESEMAEEPKDEMAEEPDGDEKPESEMAEEKSEPEEDMAKPEEFMLSDMMAQDEAEKLFSEDQMKAYSENDVKGTFSALVSIISDMQIKFAEIEDGQKEVEVDSFLATLSEKIKFSDEDVLKLRESAKNFSLENLDGWKNECKAFSFDLPQREVEVDEDEDPDMVVFARVFDETAVSPISNDIWADAVN